MTTRFQITRTAVLLFVVTLAGMQCAAAPRCSFVRQKITVDGDLGDWDGIAAMQVRDGEHLWFGQGMTPGQWQGEADLSYQWRGAWQGDGLYFAIEVTDDRLVEPNQAYSYLCDCVEIYLDYSDQGGQRVKVLDGREDWSAKCDPRELMGYELHFLPTDPPSVYLDHVDQYALGKPQSDRFQRVWGGQAACRKTANGYAMEVGFHMPDVALRAGKTIGVEIGVCDDDGQGRESIMMWTGTKSDFWITMDDYGTATLTEPPKLQSRRNAEGSWGLAVVDAGLASADQPRPLQVEIWNETNCEVTALAGGYASLTQDGDSFIGTGRVSLDGNVAFEFTDRWDAIDGTFRLARKVAVHGNASRGFLSGVSVRPIADLSWPQVHWFAPGMVYGGFDHLTDVAIGGRAHYQSGAFSVRIREDRLPAPLFAARFDDGSTLSVLNPVPCGETTAADSLDTKAVPLTDERFQFGAVGGEEKNGRIALGYWFPGTEGEVTYAGNTYPGGQLHQWRRRYHPVKDGLVQRYEVVFRFGRAEDFPAFQRAEWRRAWQTLRPRLTPQDLDAARRALADVLSANVVEKDGRTGIPNFVDAISKDLARADRKAVLGFCGKNLEAARYMLREAALDPNERGEQLRRQAESIIASFLRVKVDPPAGEGFNLDDGQPRCAIGDREVFLRSFGDDLKALLCAYQEEKVLGREHRDWLAWCRGFADWLLTQQQPAGGFPRSWKPGTGAVVSASANSSYNAVPVLALLTQFTGDQKYFNAAVRAAEFCWTNGQARSRFVGGTIDNPDVLDKEAGTLSLEAYLVLFEVTQDARWLERARAAADFAETWIYLWNVPMPPDDDNARLHWKRGVPTTGLQLISTGHTLVDAYMAFDADEFARLWLLTGDSHYRDVARLLLHNTKNMLALPGRTFDLSAPGWQQEHWSLAPPRGYGLHRGWLPWVATSQLNGIFGVLDLDAATRQQIMNPAPADEN